MKLLVVTLAPTLQKQDGLYSYAPYVKEMNLWFSHVDKVTIVSPTKYEKSLLLAPFLRKDVNVVSIPWISFNRIDAALVSVLLLPYIFLKLCSAMAKADHIHLRCPGNIGLLGAMAQLFFPKKTKTAKYAGNWDPKATQPLSYRLQKWILSSPLLTKNMQVLVYGDWPNQSKNITPFFTASYASDKVKESTPKAFAAPYRFIFVGTLAVGKRPLYAIQLVEKLHLNGIACRLDLYGDGAERTALETYITEHSLAELIILHGNQSSEVVEAAYQQSDFLLLPSQSEGWPKVVAEAMFWGVIPLVTRISCVPWMLGQGKRGRFLSLDLDQDKHTIVQLLQNKETLQTMSSEGQKFAQQYTLDSFEAAIKKLLV
ncbi:glycosyltransferase family 4 protein [Jejudonia soesokkakensis]|uniref:Glycosyltransferase family 4 protein n=1 Tax=Jejudonia soesokkakensis TaxID=1323432 RepID=A0ABW2MPR9_9FLAO